MPDPRKEIRNAAAADISANLLSAVLSVYNIMQIVQRSKGDDDAVEVDRFNVFPLSMNIAILGVATYLVSSGVGRISNIPTEQEMEGVNEERAQRRWSEAIKPHSQNMSTVLSSLPLNIVDAVYGAFDDKGGSYGQNGLVNAVCRGVLTAILLVTYINLLNKTADAPEFLVGNRPNENGAEVDENDPELDQIAAGGEINGHQVDDVAIPIEEGVGHDDRNHPMPNPENQAMQHALPLNHRRGVRMSSV